MRYNSQTPRETGGSEFFWEISPRERREFAWIRASYTFTGPVAHVRGFRIVGQVYTSATGVNSWNVNATEIRAFGPNA